MNSASIHLTLHTTERYGGFWTHSRNTPAVLATQILYVDIELASEMANKRTHVRHWEYDEIIIQVK